MKFDTIIAEAWLAMIGRTINWMVNKNASQSPWYDKEGNVET